MSSNTLWHNEDFAICPICKKWALRVRSIGSYIPVGGTFNSVDVRCLKCGFHVKGGAVDCDAPVTCPQVAEWNSEDIVKKCIPCLARSNGISFLASPKDNIAIISESAAISGDKNE